MSGASPWLLWGLLGLLAVGLPLEIYLRRELPVRRRLPLALLRAAALLLVLLLLMDPPLPGTPGGDSGPWILLDGSLSMTAGPDTSPWSRARSDLEELGRGGRPLLVFGGDDPRPLPAGQDTVPRLLTTSRLVPALERAAESGARRVVLLSDLRLEDPEAVARTLEDLGLGLEVRDVGEELPNAAVSDFTVPQAVEAGDEVAATVMVEATGGAAGEPATVQIEEEGRVVAQREVVLPDVGRRISLEVELPAPSPPSDGHVRYTATVGLPADAWDEDDTRAAWTSVDPQEGALVLVSVAPDWEPRFLLPVLGQVTGLRARGFLRVGGDRWLATDPAGAGATVEPDVVARAAREAELLVVQGGGPDAPEWLREAATGARRLLVLAGSPEAAALGGVEAAEPLPGEWYVDPELPPSPLAGALAGGELEGLPPLGPLVPVADLEGQVPLELRRGPSDPGRPAFVLLPRPEGRRAVSLAPGTWRWAFRSAAGRDGYRRLWSGVAGWLLAEGGARGSRLRPLERVVPRGAPVEWVAGALAGDSSRLRLARNDTVVLDTVLAVPETGRFTTPSLPPGLYAFSGGASSGEDAAEGRFEVEAWTSELLLPRSTALEDRPAGGGGAIGGGGGRPLRAHPLPYLLVLVLLSVEWIARRRKGLR